MTPGRGRASDQQNIILQRGEAPLHIRRRVEIPRKMWTPGSSSHATIPSMSFSMYEAASVSEQQFLPLHKPSRHFRPRQTDRRVHSTWCESSDCGRRGDPPFSSLPFSSPLRRSASLPSCIMQQCEGGMGGRRTRRPTNDHCGGENVFVVVVVVVLRYREF